MTGERPSTAPRWMVMNYRTENTDQVNDRGIFQEGLDRDNDIEVSETHVSNMIWMAILG